MEKRSTRRMRKNMTSTPSPLRELAPTKQRVLRARNNKKNTTSENDNGDAQSQQPSTTHQHVTSPSQSPQPHESHSEPEQVVESRSTSPSDQQQSSQPFGRPNTRSTSPSRIPMTNGKASSKPKTEGKKRVGRPAKSSVKAKIPSTHQGAGNSKAQGGKRNYKDMADASDADGEGADVRSSSKHHKTAHSPGQQNHIYKDDVQLVPSVKRKFEPSTHQDGSDSDDSDSPTLKRQRQRITESKIPSPVPARRLSSPRASTFSKAPFSYSGAPLRASPSAQNPFAMVPAHQPFGSSPKFTSPVRDNSESHRSPVTSYESSTIVSDNTQLVVKDTPSTSSQFLAVHESTTKNEQTTPFSGTAKKRMSRNSVATPSGIPEQGEDSMLSSPFQPESSKAAQTVPHMFSSVRGVAKQSFENVLPTSEKDTTTSSQVDASNSDPEQDSSSSLAPFVTHVKERLPPKPTSNPQRQIPTLSRPATPFINHTQTDNYDFEDSIVLSDDEADIDMEESKRKGRAWKEDYRKVRALEKEARLAREKLQRGEALGPEFNKQSPGAREIRRKHGQQSPASRNSMRFSTSQSILVFPANGSLSKITVTNPDIIGFLRTVHDQVVASNNSNTLPDPKEVAALLLNSTSKQSSKAAAFSLGQKAGNQRGIGAPSSVVKTPSRSHYDEMDHSEDDEDAIKEITLGSDSREVAAAQAVPVTPSTPAPKSGGWFSSIKSGVQRALTPFTFKGTSRAANATETEASETASVSKGSKHTNNTIETFANGVTPKSNSHIANDNETDAKTEFTFEHDHNIANTQVTPSRPSRKVKAQSERRNRAQPSRSNAPQTERKRRRQHIKPSNEAPVAEETRKFLALIADPEFKRQHHENALRLAREFNEEIKAANAAKAAATQAAKASTDFASATSKARAASRATRATEVEEEVHIRVYPNSFRAPSYSSDESDEEDESSAVKPSPGRSYGLPDAFYDNDSENEEEAGKEAEKEVEKEAEKEGEKEAQETAEAESGTARAQVPPPTPKPANAQLPFQRWVPKKPSGLRNVTAMSPIQKEMEGAVAGDGWKRIQEAVENAMGGMEQVIGKPVVARADEIEDERVRNLCPEHVQAAVFRLFN